jgi:hypothetical protein
VKVVEYSEDVLRLEDRALMLRAIGAIFALAGASILVFPHAWDGGSSLVAIFFIVLGSAIAILPRNTFIRFDRQAGTVVLQRVGTGLAPVRRQVPLEQVEKVEVEYTSSGEDAHHKLFQRVHGWLKGMHG